MQNDEHAGTAAKLPPLSEGRCALNHRRMVLAAMAGGLLAACGIADRQDSVDTEARPRIFAAASLTDVLTRIGQQYDAAGHPAPVFNFAASSELARQIEQGADADLFISADEAWMDYLAERDLIEASTRTTLLTNRLVLIAPADRPISIKLKQGMDLNAALDGGKLAIANLASVPAGKYAKEALEHFGAWAGVEAETVRAENVRATLRFVERGEAAAGIVYATDARMGGSSVQIVAEFPLGSHTPITYPAAVISGKVRAGRRFLDFLGSSEAQAVFESAGFGLR